MTIKRIYGDFAKSQLSSWESFILKHAIEKKHRTSYSTGKNSSDIALTIDAVDLLHTNRHDAFCIISSDSDFIGLAMRIRQNNIPVFGFGDHQAIKEFRQVCSAFFDIPNVSTQLQKDSPPSHSSPPKKYLSDQLKNDTQLLNTLKNSLKNSRADTEGWVNYNSLSAYLQKNYLAIKPENYGYAKLHKMIDDISLFESKKENSVIFIRQKPNNNPQNPINNPWTTTKLRQNHARIRVF